MKPRSKPHVHGWARVDGVWTCVQAYDAVGNKPETGCGKTYPGAGDPVKSGCAARGDHELSECVQTWEEPG